MRFFVVRHSERIDEKNPESWTSLSASTNRFDPWITENGIFFAQQSANTLNHLIKQSTNVMIFSSRLLRCIQTACEIANVLNLNSVNLSSKLSTVVSCVKKSKGSFRFQTIEELNSKYTTTEFICMDEILENMTTNSKNGLSWIDALQWLVEYSYKLNKIPIIVAHRETVRNLFGNKLLQTPYCCLALYEYNILSPPPKSQKKVLNSKKIKCSTMKPTIDLVKVNLEKHDSSTIANIIDFKSNESSANESSKDIKISIATEKEIKLKDDKEVMMERMVSFEQSIDHINNLPLSKITIPSTSPSSPFIRLISIWDKDGMALNIS